MYSEVNNAAKYVKWGIIGVVLIFILIAVLSLLPFTTVDSGERGVVTQFGEVKNTLEPGFHVINPFSTDVIKMDVRVQKDEVEASAASKDLQTVSAKVALNYRLDPKEVARIYIDVNQDYSTKIVAPKLQEAVKAATAKYTAEELITKRAIVKDEMKLAMQEKLNGTGILLDDFNIVNFDFSTQFNAAIESKVTAEQKAKEAQNRLVQVQAEAQQSIERAKAEAENIRLQSQAANSDRYIQLKQLEVQLEQARRWNGQLPVNLYGSAPIPFLPVK
jgi:regulator of protease activity HflC (stomatin/prohibitin superfamily)